MSQNRSYAGPHDAAELQVDDGHFVAVLRADIDDDTARNLGYALDADEAVEHGRPLVVRTITVSDELAAKLDRSHFAKLDDDGRETDELVASWPKVGGAAGDPVDSPHTNPSTMPVAFDDGTTLTSAEVDERAYTAAAALEAEERTAVETADAAEKADAASKAHERIAAIEARIAEVESAVDQAVEANDDDAHDALTAELDALTAEKAEIEKAL